MEKCFVFIIVIDRLFIHLFVIHVFLKEIRIGNEVEYFKIAIHDVFLQGYSANSV